MRYLVLSDIHANQAAFEAVLKDAAPFDMIWCLGDLVGYGPNPNECVARMQEFEHVAVAGNHDWACLGRLNLNDFNIEARMANSWTREQLTKANREYLKALPTRVERDDYTLTHGSPREPIWEYILDVEQAAVNFNYFDTSICLVGHTHIPVAFVFDQSSERHYVLTPPYSEPLSIDTDATRLILNPGSVGQPRDGDPRASYAILDTESATWELKRVLYPVQITQERMRARDLPRRLIKRLELGR